MHQQKLMDMETKLRGFISDIIHPFNDRVASLEHETASLRTQAGQAKEQMLALNAKLDSETKLRDFLEETNQKLLQMEKSYNTLFAQ